MALMRSLAKDVTAINASLYHHLHAIVLKMVEARESARAATTGLRQVRLRIRRRQP
jgi:hypothetical protein